MPRTIEEPIEAHVEDPSLEAAVVSALHSLRQDTTDVSKSNDNANDNDDNNNEDEGTLPTTTEATGDVETPYNDAPHANTREASRKRAAKKDTPNAYNDSKTSKSASKSTTPRKSDQPIDLAPQELEKDVRGLVAPPDTGIKEKARRDTSKVLSKLAGEKKDDEEGKEEDDGGGKRAVALVSNYTLCHIICSYLMLMFYAHVLCSYLMHISYAHILCTYHMLISYAHILCSYLMSTAYYY